MNQQRTEPDQEIARTVSNWLRHSAATLHDNPTGRERLLADVEGTSQRAHRWLPPIGSGGMRTLFSGIKYATAVMLLVVFGGFLLVTSTGQGDGVGPATASQSPTSTIAPSPAATSGTGRISHVTGSVVQQWIDATDQSEHWDGEVYRVRDVVILRDNAWSDPRLPSSMSFRLNSDAYAVPGVAESDRPWVGQGIARLESPDGSWVGTGQILEYPGGTTHDEWYSLEGSGDYEGLHAILRNHNELDPERLVWVAHWEGFIIEGELPQWPVGAPGDD